MESKLFLVHMHPNVINSMAAFVFLAIVKEILITLIARTHLNHSYYSIGTRSFDFTILTVKSKDYQMVTDNMISKRSNGQ